MPLRSEIARFAAAGTAGFLVDAGTLYVALALGAGYFTGRAISFSAAIWFTWQINRRFTFRTRPNQSLWKEFAQYALAMLAGGCINYAAYTACILALPKTPALPVLAVAAGSIAGMAVNFLSAKLWVFRHA